MKAVITSIAALLLVTPLLAAAKRELRDASYSSKGGKGKGSDKEEEIGFMGPLTGGPGYDSLLEAYLSGECQTIPFSLGLGLNGPPAFCVSSLGGYSIGAFSDECGTELVCCPPSLIDVTSLVAGGCTELDQDDAGCCAGSGPLGDDAAGLAVVVSVNSINTDPLMYCCPSGLFGEVSCSTG